MRPSLFLCVTAALALPGCSQNAPAPSDAPSATSANPSPAAPPPPAPPAQARSVSESNDLYEFAYAYPAQAAAVPALRDWLDKDLETTKQALIADARKDKAEASKDGYPFHAWTASKEWKVVTDLPAWLSLSTIVGSYSGGAHPNYVFEAMVWDKTAGRRMAAIDLFTSKAALSAAIRKPFCDGLTKARMKKRGEEWPGDGIDDFTKCVDPMEQVVILGSAGHKGFDRVGFLIAPYNAGPYAEGDYEVTVPVTAQVIAAVKPEYRGAFTTS